MNLDLWHTSEDDYYTEEQSLWLTSTRSNFDKIAKVRKGVTKEIMIKLKKNTNLSFNNLATILGTTKTNLHSKKKRRQIYCSYRPLQFRF